MLHHFAAVVLCTIIQGMSVYWVAAVQVIAQPEAGQHSFELQDCASYMHTQLAQLAQRHNLLHPSSLSVSDMPLDSSRPACANAAEGNSSKPDAAAQRRAQAKARQVITMTEPCTECSRDHRCGGHPIGYA